MVTQTQKQLQKALFSAAVGLCLLATVGHSAVLTPSTPTLINASLTTQTNTARNHGALHLLRPCGSKNKSLCANGGQCMYPQDTDEPFCMCTSLYKGKRCMLIADSSRGLQDSQHVIGISIGIILFLFLLLLAICICVSKKCVNSTPLIKTAPSEISV